MQRAAAPHAPAASRQRQPSLEAQRFKLALLDEVITKTTAKACLLALRSTAQIAALVAALVANGEFTQRLVSQRAYFVAWVAAGRRRAERRRGADALRARRWQATLRTGAAPSVQPAFVDGVCVATGSQGMLRDHRSQLHGPGRPRRLVRALALCSRMTSCGHR